MRKAPGSAPGSGAGFGGSPKTRKQNSSWRTVWKSVVRAFGEPPNATPGPGLLPILLLHLLTHTALAGLTAEVRPTTPRPRSQAPFTLQITLTYDGTGLLEGALNLAIIEGNETLLRHRIPDRVLTAGSTSFEVLLPDPGPAGYSELEARLTFETARDRLDLGKFTLTIPTPALRSQLILVARTGQPALDAFQALRLEHFTPPNFPAASVSTAPAQLAPEDFPTDPLAYCAYDIVLLQGRALSLLRDKQLTALTRWVEGGGSVCVIEPGDLEESGSLFLETMRPGRVGLGRTAVFDEPVPYDTARWREACAFLWKIRASQTSAIISGGRALDTSTNPQLRAQPIENINQLETELLPQETRVIPFRVILFILVAFIACIGPLDWFFLGWIKRRRLTWVLFPLTAVAFTAFTIRISEHYLGSQDSRRYLTFIDIGEDGRVLRTTRLEVSFVARAREIVTEARRALLVPMPSSGRGYNPTGDNLALGPPAYAGLIPQRHTLTQRLPQWSPQMTRTTSLGPFEEAIPTFRWDAFEGKVLQTGALHAEARQKLLGDIPGEVIIYSQATVYRKLPLPGPPLEWMKELSVPPTTGWFGFVSAMSPTGARNYADLAMLDSTDASQKLVVVVVQDGPDWLVYRRLYHVPK